MIHHYILVIPAKAGIQEISQSGHPELVIGSASNDSEMPKQVRHDARVVRLSGSPPSRG